MKNTFRIRRCYTKNSAYCSFAYRHIQYACQDQSQTPIHSKYVLFCSGTKPNFEFYNLTSTDITFYILTFYNLALNFWSYKNGIFFLYNIVHDVHSTNIIVKTNRYFFVFLFHIMYFNLSSCITYTTKLSFSSWFAGEGPAGPKNKWQSSQGQSVCKELQPVSYTGLHNCMGWWSLVMNQVVIEIPQEVGVPTHPCFSQERYKLTTVSGRILNFLLVVELIGCFHSSSRTLHLNLLRQ